MKNEANFLCAITDLIGHMTGTREAMAILFMLRHGGIMNSSRRISPGCTGFSFLGMC